MSDFTYQEGTALTWAQMNENLRLMQAKYLDSANSAAIAVAAANFKGNWTALTGALAVPASVYHSSKFWLLLSNLADVTAKVPGVDAEWLEIITGNVMGPASATDGHAAIFDGTTGKLLKSGPIAQALGSASLPSYTFSGDVNSGMWSPGADILAWSTGGSERLRIDTSGNVGVGTSSPNQGGFDRTITLNATTTQAAIEIGTQRADFGAAGLGALRWRYETNSAGHKAVAGISSVSSGTTPNQRGAYLSFETKADGSTALLERMQIDSSGNVLITGSGGLGYGVGSGGSVTQATSKSTAVTLNKPSGQITMNNAALGANTTVSFNLNNSLLTINDGIALTMAGSIFTHGNYQIWAGNLTAGVITIYLRNISGGSLSEAVVFKFQVIKGATS